METRKVAVEGMIDQSDANKVSRALHEVWGVRHVEVNLARGEAVFSYDEHSASFIDFQQALADSGYRMNEIQ
ncbi:heavy-metal-associated domain-containing protein [Effusibacillus dendaii]|uniref:HMA domain-containing protein n=1 Tax=Effusibacillus dendaii TaxID=2743772 RepID=A0A7I8D9W7_9BACL|nr:heavy-metal-associated domain-containing protein [Effusibacillus dendaii]BCJ86162.1 hypothetical protein skT53_11470 [Effusibacillus dendaii]